MKPSTNTNGGHELEVALAASVAVGRVGTWRAPPGVPVAAALAAPAPVEASTALTFRRMRQAAVELLGEHAGVELVRTIASYLVLDPNEDVRALVRSSIARLQRPDVRAGAPHLAEDVDVEACADAIARAWREAA